MSVVRPPDVRLCVNWRGTVEPLLATWRTTVIFYFPASLTPWAFWISSAPLVNISAGS